MGVSSIIVLLGGLAFFLFGMSIMGDALQKAAGNRMEMILGRLASTRFKGVLLGTFVTAIIQSSSATSIMVVSFVNSGIMKLGQGISVILGANIGTTATGWLLTLAGVDSGSHLGSLLSTTTIFAVVAVVGLLLFMFSKTGGKKNAGVILLALSVLMSGMKTMSSAMEPLAQSDAFVNALSSATSPMLCVLAGILVTAVVQSCSASIGILQALSMTGVVSFNVAIPTVIGMSIGACVPVLLSAIGANVNGKRTAFSYLYFNILGGTVSMIIFYIFSGTAWGSEFLSGTAYTMDIAIVNTLFKVFSVVIIYPFVPQLKHLVCCTFSGVDAQPEEHILDERLLNYPSQAIEQSGRVVSRMAELAESNINICLSLFDHFDRRKYEALLAGENEVDLCEDKLSAFIIKLNSRELTGYETRQTAKFLHCMMDLERISDHAENMAELAMKLSMSEKPFTHRAAQEISVLMDALREIISITVRALTQDSMEDANRIEPLEEIVDTLTEELKLRHIKRLQNSICAYETSFVFNDCINNLERVADHCSNIAISVMELHDESAVESHDFLRSLKQGDSVLFKQYVEEYREKYLTRLSGISLPVCAAAAE